MRKRKWVLILLFTGMLTYLAGYAVWSIFKADEKIKHLLLQHINPFLAEGSGIQELDITFGGMHLKGVTLIPQNRAFTLYIEDLQLRYSIWNLIRHRLNPNAVTDKIFLVRPKIVLAISPVRDSKKETQGLEISSSLWFLQSLQQVTVLDGKLFLKTPSDREILISHSINGIITVGTLDSSAVIRMGWALFEAKEPNVQWNASLDLSNGKLDFLSLKLDPSSLYTFAPILSPVFEPRQGTVRGEWTFQKNTGFRGFFEIQNAGLGIKNTTLELQKIHTMALWEGSTIQVSGKVDDFHGSKFTLGGRIQELPSLQLDLYLACDALHLGGLVKAIYKNFPSLTADSSALRILVTGPFLNPVCKGEWKAKNVRGAGLNLDRMKALFGFQEKRFTLQTVGQKPDGLFLNLEMDSPFKDHVRWIDFRCLIEGDLIPSVPEKVQKRFKHAFCRMDFKANGKLDNIVGQGEGRFSYLTMNGLSDAFVSQLSYSKQRITVFAENGEGFHLKGEIQDFLKKNMSWEISIQNLQQWGRVFLDSTQWKNYVNLKVASQWKGNFQKWDFRFLCQDTHRTAHTDIFSGLLRARKKGREYMQYDFQCGYKGPEGDLFPVEIHGLVSRNEAIFQNCKAGDFFSAEYWWSRGTAKPKAKGRLWIQQLVFQNLHPIFPSLKSYMGEVNASLQWEGEVFRPGVNLNASLRKGAFHKIGGLEGDVTLEIEPGRLKLFSVSIQKNDVPLLVGKIYPDRNDSLRGKIQSGNLDLGELVTTIFGKNQKFNGEGIAQIRAQGTATEPQMWIWADFHDGTLGPISFQRLKVLAREELFLHQGFRSGVLSIEQGNLSRSDGFEMDFGGEIAHTPYQPNEIWCQLKGNVLGILPEWLPFIKKAKGSGEGSLRFSLQPFRLKSGRLQVNQGTVTFTEIVPQIEKFQVDLALSEGDSLLNILGCKGQIEGTPFSISNRPCPDSSFEKSSLFLKPLGIHLGIFQLRMGSKGILAYIPGLMPKGEKGRIVLSGFKKGEPFQLMAFRQRLYLKGTLGLSDTRFTYPFLSVKSSSGETNATPLLKKIYWNVHVIPKENVHYVREIQSPVGNAYVDLKLQDGMGGIFIEGCLEDQTFQVWGNLVSVEGTLEVLDRYFKPERLTFDYPRGGSPIFSGRASTTVIDSTGVPSTVWLELVALDRETGAEKKQGPWDKVQFQFSTDNPNLGRTEADLLSLLDYSQGKNIKDRAYEAIGVQVENWVFRPLFRPIEKGMRRYLGLDMVKFSSTFSRNFLEWQRLNAPILDPQWFLQKSKVTLGISVAPGLMLMYSGEVGSGLSYTSPMYGIGLRHAIFVQYIIRPELLLELEYDYDSMLLHERREDKRIFLKHVFPL